jgi:hypothetical protein
VLLHTNLRSLLGWFLTLTLAPLAEGW